MVFLLDHFLFDMLSKTSVFCWKKKANLKMSKVSTCQAFLELCLLHMKGCEMLLQKGVVIYASVCVLYKTTSLSFRISVVFACF